MGLIIVLPFVVVPGVLLMVLVGEEESRWRLASLLGAVTVTA